MQFFEHDYVRMRVIQFRRRFSANDGYTLVEILVVLAIIAMIMGLVGPRVLAYLSGSKAKTAKIQIGNLKAAVDLYVSLRRGPPCAVDWI